MNIERTRALVLLVQAMFDQLDEIISLEKRGAKASVSRLLLDEMSGVLRELDAESLAEYHRVLVSIGAGIEVSRAANIDEQAAEFTVEPRRRMLAELKKVLQAA